MLIGPAGDGDIVLDQHEASGARVLAEGIERQKRARAQDDLGDAVALDLLRLRRREVGGVEHPLDLLHLDGHGRGVRA